MDIVHFLCIWNVVTLTQSCREQQRLQNCCSRLMYIVLLAVSSGALEGYTLRSSVDLCCSISFDTEQVIDPKITAWRLFSLACSEIGTPKSLIPPRLEDLP